MDEAAWRATRDAVAPRACVFQRALLARCADCGLAVRHALAEREAIACASPVAQANCATFAAMLRERAAFALKGGHAGAALPHALAMRLQCGGVAGLAVAAEAAASRDDRDVHALVAAAQAKHGGLTELPWPAVVAAVVAWQGRPRRGSGR